MIEKQLFQKKIKKIKNTLNISRNLPYYQKLYKDNGINVDDINSYEDFTNIPILDKKLYRDNQFDFLHMDTFNQGFNVSEYKQFYDDIPLLCDYLKKFNLRLRTTSGSTGMPMEIIIHQEDLHRAYFTLNMYRIKHFKDIFKHHYAMLWFISNNECSAEKFAKRKGYGYQYNLYNISDKEFSDLIQFFIDYDIRWIVGNPSLIYALSEYIILNQIHVNISHVECQSEFLFDWQRKMIQKAFKVNPISIYSSNEVHFIAATCSRNSMHILDDNAFVEIVENAEGVEEVIVTNLHARYMPMIRYKLGDTGEWVSEQCNCEVGHMPVLQLKAFRINDIVLSKYGVKYSNWIVTQSIMLVKQKFQLDFDQYQVVQLKYDYFTYTMKIEKVIGQFVLEQIKHFICDYFYNILHYPVHIDIHITHETILGNGVTSKFKYFVNKILQGDNVQAPNMQRYFDD